MRISIIGSGQVGSRVGRTLAAKGNEVIFFDVFEKPLIEIKKQGYKTTLDLKEAIFNSEISIIAVPTPLKEEKFDFTFIEKVSEECGKIIAEKKEYHVFVLKSTITPGTTKNLFIPILEKYSGKKSGKDFGVVYNPEFLTVIENSWTADDKFKVTPEKESKIVLGTEDDRAFEAAKKLYDGLNIPIFKVNFETAEAVKMTANSRLPLVISFSNQVSELMKEINEKKKMNIDVNKVIELVALDPRIGKYGSIFGKAYSGPCFNKDPNAFNSFLKESGKTATLIDETIKINEEVRKKYGARE